MPTWRVEVQPTAEKRLLKLDQSTRHRILQALQDIEEAEQPLWHPQVRALTGELQGDFRLRVGDWRVLFVPEVERKMLFVYAIVPRREAHR